MIIPNFDANDYVLLLGLTGFLMLIALFSVMAFGFCNAYVELAELLEEGKDQQAHQLYRQKLVKFYSEVLSKDREEEDEDEDI